MRKDCYRTALYTDRSRNVSLSLHIKQHVALFACNENRATDSGRVLKTYLESNYTKGVQENTAVNNLSHPGQLT